MAVQFDHLTNIATIGSSVNNDIYVADSLNSRIQKFTGDDIFVTGWGDLKTHTLQLLILGVS